MVTVPQRWIQKVLSEKQIKKKQWKSRLSHFKVTFIQIPLFGSPSGDCDMEASVADSKAYSDVSPAAAEAAEACHAPATRQEGAKSGGNSRCSFTTAARRTNRYMPRGNRSTDFGRRIRLDRARGDFHEPCPALQEMQERLQ